MRALVPLLSALALAAALVWCSRPERGRAASAPPTRAVAKGAESSARDPAAALELAPAPALALAEFPEPPRREASGPTGLAVAGRIEVAGGLPPGREPLVVARAYRGDVSRLHSRRIETRAARDGSFALSVPADTRSVGLEIEARLLYLTEEVEVAPGTLDVVLRPRLLALLRGRVHAPLEFWNNPAPISVAFGSASQGYAERDGSFELVVEPGEEALLFARSRTERNDPHSTPLETHRALAALRPGEERWVELVLEPWTTLRGVVSDASGAPLAGAVVTLEPTWSDGRELFRRSESSTTGLDGRFELGPLGQGTWDVRVSAEGRRATLRTFELPADAESWHVIELAKATRVTGRVFAPDGTPVAGARVLWQDEPDARPGRVLVPFPGRAPPPPSEQRTTDEHGRFELELEREGRIVARSSGFAESLPFDPDASGAARDFELHLRPACSIRVRVLDEEERAVNGILAFRSEDGTERFLVADEGVVVGRGLPPGRAWIEVRRFLRESNDTEMPSPVEVILTPEFETQAELRIPRSN